MIMHFMTKSVYLVFGVVALSVLLPRIDACFTPDGIVGECVILKNCSSLMAKLLSKTRQESDNQFLRDSSCGVDTQIGWMPKVCCSFAQLTPTTLQNPSNTDFEKQDSNSFGNQEGNIEQKYDPSEQEENVSPSVRTNFIHKLLPTNCGTSLSNRIVGGTVSELGSYPWLAIIEFTKTNGRKALSCGGAIINDRYILTAAHCVVGKDLPKTWQLNSVRLGEYNITSERDCIPDGYNPSRTCIEDPPLSIRVEQQFVHEYYDPYSSDQRNDIALLRLAEKIKFSPYVSPVCLPSNSKIEPQLTVAGWGTTERDKASDVILKVELPYVDMQRCSSVYRQNGIPLGEGQMCAGGEKGKDSCRGDSGGPLIQQDSTDDGADRWIAVGVVSFGPSPCGLHGIPGVYTTVYEYLPWIINKLRP